MLSYWGVVCRILRGGSEFNPFWITVILFHNKMWKRGSAVNIFDFLIFYTLHIYTFFEYFLKIRCKRQMFTAINMSLTTL